MKSCNPNPDGGQVWDATYFKLLEETIFVDASKFFLSVDWRTIRGCVGECLSMLWLRPRDTLRPLLILILMFAFPQSPQWEGWVCRPLSTNTWCVHASTTVFIGEYYGRYCSLDLGSQSPPVLVYAALICPLNKQHSFTGGDILETPNDVMFIWSNEFCCFIYKSKNQIVSMCGFSTHFPPGLKKCGRQEVIKITASS